MAKVNVPVDNRKTAAYRWTQSPRRLA